MSKVSIVITSYNRPDLLQRTIDSFIRFNDYPISEIIIIEDSACKPMQQWLLNYTHILTHKTDYNFRVMINPVNIGAYESIDIAYAEVKTPFVCHIEDDWEFLRGGFLDKAVKVLDHDKMVMQVNFEHNPFMSTVPGVLIVSGTAYQIVGTDTDGWWHGFTCHPSLRSMEAYQNTAPWTQWSESNEDLSQRELKVGLEYFRQGYKAAILKDSYCKHIGDGRCTWHENT